MIDPRDKNVNPQKSALRYFRLKILGISQSELAERIGTTQNTISRYESGRHKTISFTLDQICALDELLRSKGMTFADLRDLADGMSQGGFQGEFQGELNPCTVRDRESRE